MKFTGINVNHFVGKFRPPRSSQNDYFSNSNCTFNFYFLNKDLRLLLWYDYFNIVDHDMNCPSDNLTYTYKLKSSSKFSSYPFIYCGYRNYPSPYLTIRSTEQFRIHFRSNDDANVGLGFDGRYQFLNQSNIYFSSSCRSPFDPMIYINETDKPSGNLSSNGHRENVICEWTYITRTGFQFNLELNMLEIEGSQAKDPPQGCQSSVLRIISQRHIDELCGQRENDYYFLTDTHWFTIQYISLRRQTKEALHGFRLLWTVVQVQSNNTDNQCLSSNDYFDCKKTSTSIVRDSFCVHRSLLCDGRVHCQPLSNNDELSSICSHKIPTHSKFSLPTLTSISFLHQHLILIIITIILCIVMLCVAIILMFLLIKMKRKQHQIRVSKEIKIEQHRPRQTQQDHLSSKIKSNQIYFDDEENNQRLLEMNTMEQTVTTV